MSSESDEIDVCEDVDIKVNIISNNDDLDCIPIASPESPRLVIDEEQVTQATSQVLNNLKANLIKMKAKTFEIKETLVQATPVKSINKGHRLTIEKPVTFHRRIYLRKINDFKMFLKLDAVAFPVGTSMEKKLFFRSTLRTAVQSLEQLSNAIYDLNDFHKPTKSKKDIISQHNDTFLNRQMPFNRSNMTGHILPYPEVIQCSQPSTSNFRSTQSICFDNQLIENSNVVRRDPTILQNYLNARTVTKEGNIIPTDNITVPKVTTVTTKALTEFQIQALNNMNAQAFRELRRNISKSKTFF
jgi:hypothetical protein